MRYSDCEWTLGKKFHFSSHFSSHAFNKAYLKLDHF